MLSSALWSRHLTHREVQVFCLLAIGLHLLPLLLADYTYMDDVWRTQVASDSWTGEGRVLTGWLYAVLSFGPGAPNLFPLPLLLAAVASALVLARLVQHYFVAPDASAVLVVLPLWYNPFFLQNLSYQFDGPTMALSLAASVLAITFDPERRRYLIYGAVWVAIAASFYQVSLNLFAGLCCVEVLRQVVQGADFRQVLMHALGRLGQLLGGCLLYYLSAFQLMTSLRQSLLAFDGQWPGMVLQRLQLIAEHLGLLFTPGTTWFMFGLLALALLGVVLAAARLLRGEGSVLARLGLLLALLLPVPMVVLLVPGLTLLFADFNDGARTLMGLGTVMVLVLWLAHRLLTALHLRLGWLLLIPLLCMLSFAYAYGRVLLVEKELQQAISFSLAHDISSRPDLASARRYYVLDIDSSGQWLPAASGSVRAMPALKYVLNINFLLLPEMMPRLGLSNFGSHVPLGRRQVLARSPQPRVDNKFYAIHLVGDVGYVLMKTPRDPESYRW